MSRKRLRLADDSLHPLLRQHGRQNRQSILSAAYSSFSTIPKILHSHTSCVNALEFSVDGTYMGSGGDDLRVTLWKGDRVVGNYLGHEANIFSIGFMRNDPGKIISGGMDERVYIHDLEYGEGKSKDPVTIYADHEGGVRRVSPHPTSPHIFLTASEDGTVRKFDTRTRTAVGLLDGDLSSFNDVVYNPITPDLFATADGDGKNHLHDARKSFADSSEGKDAKKLAVLRYATSLIAPGKVGDAGVIGKFPGDDTMLYKESEPDSSSLAFDPTGKLLCATVSRFLPILYEMNNEVPLALFDHQSVGQGTYSNLCTVKNGSFGGSGDDLYYAAGSDDFAAYIWKVPSVNSLRDRRRNLDGAIDESDWIFPPSTVPAVGFMTESVEDGLQIIVPPSITSPQRLYQHRSIVNTALFHPTLPLLYTCGIEKVIRVHSSILSSPFPKNDTVAEWIPRERRIDSFVSMKDEEKEDPLGKLPSEIDSPTSSWRIASSRRENRRTLDLFDSYLSDDVEPLWGASINYDDDSEDSNDPEAYLYEGAEYDDLERLARDFPEYDSDDPGANGRGDDGSPVDWGFDENDSGVDQDEYP